MKTVLAFLLILSFHAFAQLGGPSIGLVPDAGSVRVMYGSAAAGAVGDWQDPGQALALVEVSPSQDLVLASAADSGQLLLVSRSRNAPPTPVTGAAASPDRIVFSPNGSAAALWFAASSHIQVIAGLPNAATVRDVDTAYLDASPTSLAVSDDAAWVVGAWPQGAYAFGPDGQPILLPTDGAPMAVAFFHARPDLAMITPRQVVTIAGVGQQSAVTVLWSNPNPPTDAPAQTAVGFAVSSDNQRVSVTGNWGGIYTINLASNNEGSYVMCGCTPTALASLGGTLYRLTGVVEGSVKVYDAAVNQVWTVPLANTAAGVNGGGQ